MTNKTITAPKGFLAAGITAGIKKSGKKDIGLIVCPTGAKAAAVFTTNKIVSSAVTVSKKHVKSREIYTIIINSGNAWYHLALRLCTQLSHKPVPFLYSKEAVTD